MSDLLIWFLKAIAGKVLGEEAGLLCSGLSGSLLRVSVRLLAAKDRERYAEEWASDLQCKTTSLRRLAFAVGTLRAAAVLRHMAVYPGVSFGVPALIRLIDVIFGAFSCVISLPIFIVVSCAIFIGRGFKGPIVTREIQRDGKEWKAETLRFAVDDMRSPRLSIFLYRTWLETLPEAWQLVTGELSLVGRQRMMFSQSRGHHRLSSRFEERLLTNKPGVFSVGALNTDDGIQPITLEVYFRHVRKGLFDSMRYVLGCHLPKNRKP